MPQKQQKQQKQKQQKQYVHQIFEDPGEADEDPDSVSALLSNELLQLSLNDRNAIQEEIHGVRCLAPEETEDLLESSLAKLEAALKDDAALPPNQKEAFLMSQSLPKTYVNDDSFRLRFLRYVLFDIEQAAKQIVRFLRVAVELFGDIALERPIGLNDFNTKELKYFREGEIQFLPFRDRIGRRILCIMNPMLPRDDIDIPIARAKIGLYMTWTAGDDLDVQRKGLVYLVRFTSKFESISATDCLQQAMILKKTPKAPVQILCTVRCSAVHICSPNKSLYRIANNLISLRISKMGRKRMKIHFGECVELQYALHAYGIPTEYIPLTFSGNIKDAYIKQWLRLRAAVEYQAQNECSSHKNNSIIECPQLEDVLFRQGVSSLSYPGNLRLHRLVEELYKDTETIPDGGGSTTARCAPLKRGMVKSKREKVVQELVRIVSSRGDRFLVWNDQGWWNELKGPSQRFPQQYSQPNERLTSSILQPPLQPPINPQLVTKLEYFIKEVLRHKRQRGKEQQQQQQQQQQDKTIASSSSPLSTKKTIQDTQQLDSSTSIFQNQQDDDNFSASCRGESRDGSNKRTKLEHSQI